LLQPLPAQPYFSPAFPVPGNCLHLLVTYAL
jgi:hypothetical protein